MKLFCLIVMLSLLQFGAIHSFSLTNPLVKQTPDENLKVEIQSVTDRYRNPEERKKLKWDRPDIDIRPNHHVIEFKVRNDSDEKQGFRVMSCSYSQHWATDNKRVYVAFYGIGCGGNARMLITLKPGESYTSILPIALQGVAPGEVLEFRMSFTPFRKDNNTGRFRTWRTFWSNVLKIKGEDVNRKT